MDIVIGSLLCAVAGICVGTFLLPLKYSRTWKWENSWLVGAFFMYVFFPVVTLYLVVPQFGRIYAQTPSWDILMIYVFGLIQGTRPAMGAICRRTLGVELAALEQFDQRTTAAASA